MYNLAAQSHVAVSFKNPMYSIQSGTIGPVSLLEAVKTQVKNKILSGLFIRNVRGEDTSFLNEESKFVPKSPYASNYLLIHKIYRESYGIHAVNGILFNHESPERGETLKRKIKSCWQNIPWTPNKTYTWEFRCI